MKMIGLPIELIIYISDYLNNKDKFSIFFTCKTLKNCSKIIYLRHVHSYEKVKYHLENYRFEKVFYMTNDINIPYGVTWLQFKESFNKPLNNYIPNTVTKIKFGKDFNQSINGCLSNNIKFLEFGQNFNQSIENLPSSVKSLKFFGNYDRKIHGEIPKGVKKLYFYKSFTEFVSDNVTHLFVNDIDENKMKYIPKTVTHLKFGSCFNQSIKGYIPQNITHLKFGYSYSQKLGESSYYIVTVNPSNFDFDDCTKPYPNNVVLIAGKSFLPSSLTHLTLSKSLYEKNKDTIDPRIKITVL